MKKKLTALFLAAMLCVALCVPAFADDPAESGSIQVELVTPVAPDAATQLIIDQQAPAVNAYQELMANIETIVNDRYMYPGTYAGAYIDDSHKLCVSLTDCSETTIAQYTAYFSNPAVVYFTEAEYSYNELSNIMYSVVGSSSAVSCAYVDERSNVVKVGTPNTVLPVNTTHVDSDLPIEWYYEEGIPATSLVGGLELDVEGTYCTLGICGTYYGNDAILLCGHSLSGGDEICLSDSSDCFAYITALKFEEGLAYDYAVANIYANSNVTLTNKVKSGTSSTVSITSQMTSKTPIGQVVCKYGARSKYGTGEVETNTLIWKDSTSGVTVNNMIKCTYLNDSCVKGGDSGGPVYVGNVFHGTISGGSETSGFFVFSPVSGVAGFSVKTS